MALLRLEEVATQLGISYTQARVLVLYDNTIPYVTVGVRGIRVEEKALEKYLEKLRKTPSGSEEMPTREPYKGREILKEGGNNE